MQVSAGGESASNRRSLRPSRAALPLPPPPAATTVPPPAAPSGGWLALFRALGSLLGQPKGLAGPYTVLTWCWCCDDPPRPMLAWCTVRCQWASQIRWRARREVLAGAAGSCRPSVWGALQAAPPRGKVKVWQRGPCSVNRSDVSGPARAPQEAGAQRGFLSRLAVGSPLSCLLPRASLSEFARIRRAGMLLPPAVRTVFAQLWLLLQGEPTWLRRLCVTGLPSRALDSR